MILTKSVLVSPFLPGCASVVLDTVTYIIFLAFCVHDGINYGTICVSFNADCVIDTGSMIFVCLSVFEF